MVFADIPDDIRELRSPDGGWQTPAVRRWVSAVAGTVVDAAPDQSVYCSGSPIHRLCIGYDPQTKRPCSCSCHDKGRS